MTKETKDDIIKMLKQDLRILRLEKDNKQLQLDNLLLIVLTLQRERDIYLEKDRQALEKMNENDNDKEYISYLENKERDLLEITHDFLVSYKIH